MKKLFLVRHGKSSWDHPGLTDFERPLNERGRNNAQALGKFFKENGILPDEVYSSPANRAISTARFVCMETGFSLEKIHIRESIYEAGIADLFGEIKKVTNTASSLMIFGHNPGFIMLAGILASQEIELFSTCAVFGVELEIDSWDDIETARGRCFLFQSPKKNFL